ncbi:hypothetical protein D3C73_1062460 [compost metagenome]
MVFIMRLPFIAQRLYCPGHTLNEFIVTDRLQDIIKSLQLDCLLGIAEIGVSGQENAAQIRPAFGCRLNQLQAAHPRHGDIGDEDINVLLLKKFQRLSAGHRLMHLIYPDLFPGDRMGQAFGYIGFIVD